MRLSSHERHVEYRTHHRYRGCRQSLGLNKLMNALAQVPTVLPSCQTFQNGEFLRDTGGVCLPWSTGVFGLKF